MVNMQKEMLKVGMKCVGFFNEYECNGLYSLKELKKRKRSNDVKIVDYIKNGFPYVCAAHICYDVFDNQTSIGGYKILTDGLYIWPNYFGYYIEKYNIAVDDDFLEHIKKHNYKLPVEDDIVKTLRTKGLLS